MLLSVPLTSYLTIKHTSSYSLFSLNFLSSLQLQTALLYHSISSFSIHFSFAIYITYFTIYFSLLKCSSCSTYKKRLPSFIITYLPASYITATSLSLVFVLNKYPLFLYLFLFKRFFYLISLKSPVLAAAPDNLPMTSFYSRITLLTTNIIY